MLVLIVTILLGQESVDQGAPGNQGPWPVSGVSTNSDGGSTSTTASRYPVTCDVTSSHQITSVTTSTTIVPNNPTGGRYYVNICNSVQNAPAAVVKCRADGVVPVLASGNAGDVLLYGDCVMYSGPPYSGAIQCIADAARNVTTYECVPVPSGSPTFTLQQTFSLGQFSQLPACVGDAHCVALCTVSPSSGDWECFDNTGALMTGMTQGNNSTYVSSFAHSVDGGWFQALNYVDDTASAAAIPRINNAAIRAAFGGAHTVAAAGYSGTVVNSNGGWWAMITDGTNYMQIRNGGSQFEFLETGTATEATAGTCKNGWCVVGLRRSGATLTGRSQGVNGAGTGGDTVAAVTGVNAFYMGGGTGGCCTPGGGMGGPLAWVAIYDESKTDAWFEQTEKNWYGAQQVQSGGLGSPGTAQGGSPIGRDDLQWSGGGVPIFLSGAYITDPNLGLRSQKAAANFWAVDPLAAATWTAVGTPTITSNVSPGPFFRWKNLNTCDLIVDDDGTGFEGAESLTAGTTNTFYNASCYLMAGDSGTTVTKARIRFVTDGVVDAGFQTCDVSGLDYTARRYPLDGGCWAWIDNATSVKADVLVGTAAAETGSITACQCQLTKSLFPESPTVDNIAKGDNWPELDGGGIPYGLGQGKLEAVFYSMYPSLQLAPYYAARSPGQYIFDAYNVGASHDILLLVTAFNTYDAGIYGEPALQALLYGNSQSYENRFEPMPVVLDGGTFYVWSYEWYPQYGLLPDAGPGVGCRGISRLDMCPPSTSCVATTIVGSNSPPIPSTPVLPFGQNSGNLGTCPSYTSVVDLGTRIAGSSVTSGWVKELRIYK